MPITGGRNVLDTRPNTEVGFLVGLAVHGADVQDRDGAPDLLKSITAHYPLLRHVFADDG